MSNNKPAIDPQRRVGAIADIARNARLIWRLYKDRRVPLWNKAVPLLALAYVVFPLDFIPDALLGLGQLDDLTIILLGLKAFVSLSPAALVSQHDHKLRQEDAGRTEETIDTSYRVLDEKGEDDPRRQ